MKTVTLTFILTSLTTFALAQEFPGNSIVQLIQYKDNKNLFINPIDDTINYKHVIDNIYTDADNRVYILNVSTSLIGDNIFSNSSLATEYFRDYTDFIDLKTYRLIKDDYFVNNHKVYLWFLNSDGTFPVEIEQADFKTFKPFDNVCGGIDKNHVFYGSPQDGINIVIGANPRTIKVLNPKRGCWNCGNCYFKDDKNVFFGLKKIEGVDVKTFKLVNQNKVDCIDNNNKYFNGEPIR